MSATKMNLQGAKMANEGDLSAFTWGNRNSLIDSEVYLRILQFAIEL